jgi:putative membrane protein
MKPVIKLMLIVSVVGLLSCNDDNDKKSLNSTDENFSEQAALGNMAEIDLATLASTKAANQSVKDFAQHMITEHNEAQNELHDIADDYSNVNWPTALDAEHTQVKQQLQGLSGMAFDTAYISSQVKDHAKVIVLFQTEQNSGSENNLKQYAAKYFPHIQEHYSTASGILNELKGNK